jgi:hypothetical protein
MNASHSFLLRCLTGISSLLIATGLDAAPLTWFPGPTLWDARSGSAAVLRSGGANLLIAGDSSTVQALFATNSAWTYFSPFSDTRIAPGAVSEGGMIIVYGGSDGTTSLNSVIGYSTSDGSTNLAPMLAARSYLGYAPDRSGTPYAFGGLDDTGTPLASGEKYDQDHNTWSPIASMPALRYNFPAVFDKTNLIYVFGGYSETSSGQEITAALRYSVSKNTWTNLAPMPVAVAGSAAALGADGKFYVVGGLSGGVATNAVQIYDPNANSWTISTPLPESLSAACMGLDSLGRLVVMGGMDVNGNDVSDVWRSQQLGIPDAAPTLTQLPATNGVYNGLYSSSINATGSPPPIYELMNGPVGMQVDYYSGAITWTPGGLSQIGDIPVTVQAANYAGSTNWDFTIHVPYPHPAPVTNLAVVAVAETSVTLSWAPEDAIFGPCTFGIWTRHVAHSPRGSGVTIWYTEIASVGSATSATIGGLAPGKSDAYYLVAYGPGGNSGTNSNISATTASLQPPTNVRITGLTSTSINFAWDPPSGSIPAVSYEVWAWDNFGVSTVSTRYGTGITDTTFTVSGLPRGASHNWAVRAFDALGYSSAFAFFNSGSLVYNPVPVAPQITNAVLSAGSGGFQLTVAEGGNIQQTLWIQATTNPVDPTAWEQIGSVYPTNNPFTFTDTNSALYPVRFYRIVAP